MTLSINDFRAQLPGQGSRPSLFYVQITNPIDGSSDNKIQFLCKTADLPATRLNVINVGYKGRKVKIAGQKEFGPWQVTVINDETLRFVTRLKHGAMLSMAPSAM